MLLPNALYTNSICKEWTLLEVVGVQNITVKIEKKTPKGDKWHIITLEVYKNKEVSYRFLKQINNVIQNQ